MSSLDVMDAMLVSGCMQVSWEERLTAAGTDTRRDRTVDVISIESMGSSRFPLWKGAESMERRIKTIQSSSICAVSPRERIIRGHVLASYWATGVNWTHDIGGASTSPSVLWLASL